MQDNTPKYWRGIEELENTPEFVKNAHNEFPEFLPVLNNKSEGGAMPTADRRDFLKLMGFSIAAATLASCDAPVRKAIPYLNKPEEIEPGIANWYASSYFEGGEYNSVLVKTREGRPIKLEGNPQSPITRGGLTPRAQASVLNLYDDSRLRGPLANNEAVSWEDIDRAITGQLGQGGRVVLVSNTIISPSTKRVINEFLGRFGGEHVVYDPKSCSAMLAANETSLGRRIIPSYDFSRAQVIVGIGADFLSTWLSPVEHAKQYIVNRKVSSDNRRMSKHFQFECMMTVTGANADVRVPVKPSEEAMVVAALHNRLAGGSAVDLPAHLQRMVEQAASELGAARGAGLVVSDSQDAGIQLMVNQINQQLGAYGTIIDATAPTYVRQGNDQQMMNFVNSLAGGGVGTVIFYNANPVYDHPMGGNIASALGNVPLTISFSERADETAQHCKFLCPDNNYLESWNDHEPRRGFLSITQPTISTLFNTRQAQDSLLVWSGSNIDYYTYMQRQWRGVLAGGGNFVNAWDRAVHDGLYQAQGTGYSSVFDQTTQSGVQASTAAANLTAGTGIELALYEKPAMGAGQHANNPWLLEMADPITRACWDNYLCMSQAMAKRDGYEQGDIVTVKAGPASATLPVLVQPGVPDNAVAIAIGWGRTHAGPAGNGVGANAFPFVQATQNGLRFVNNVEISKTGDRRDIAQIQTHHTVMDRLVVQESTLAQYNKDPKSVTKYIKIATPLDPSGVADPTQVSLWKDYDYKNHHWGMVIDLNSCIGCGSCTLGCQAENNVPVVGRAEVLMRREMHWMRIDRYYSSDTKSTDTQYGALERNSRMEDPSENPKVIFQPMLCQQCNHAPCETVCPVAATTHSSEGLNQMAYSRCIGTRYCANNCPYKVRRFNWFNYQNDYRIVDVNLTTDLQRMVLNPDVTVRARGVMEKCTFCVQRIQLGKLEAKKERRRPVDGEIVTACAQSCPTNAIIFGDMNDPNSQVSQILMREQGERAFHVLAEINTQPNVTYLTKIRNIEPAPIA